MKIGILTFHNAYNFGAVLQAYALQNYLESQNCQVEIIDYRNIAIEDNYNLLQLKRYKRRNILKVLLSIVNNAYKVVKFNQFRKDAYSLLKLSERVFEIQDKNIIDKDAIIIGSDQLWNKKYTKAVDPFYWGKFADSSALKVISYAVSIDANYISASDLKYICECLKNFDSLSVRESDSVKFLSSLTNKKIHVSLDPTLLVEREMWLSLIGKTSPYKDSPYIAVYAILERKKVIENAKKLAKALHKRLIIISPIAQVSLFNGDVKPTRLSDFLSIIAYADFVLTSSFHGLAFSLIFHKDFYVMGDSSKNERMKSLLCQLGLTSRFIEEMYINKLSSIDYVKVEKKIGALRMESQKYLLNSIYK